METIVLKDRVTGNMSDDEFLQFCIENRDLRIERNNKLEIIIMTPVTTLSSYSSGATFAALANWTKLDGRGFAFDSSTGFTLPDRSVFSPDAAWLSKKKWNALSDDDKDRFAPVCPEFVIEVRSKSDNIEDLKKKMFTWLKNGAQEAWLLDPIKGISFIYRPSKDVIEINGFDSPLAGEGPVQGFVLHLSQLKME